MLIAPPLPTEIYRVRCRLMTPDAEVNRASVVVQMVSNVNGSQ